jgi:hypothetical protein
MRHQPAFWHVCVPLHESRHHVVQYLVRHPSPTSSPRLKPPDGHLPQDRLFTCASRSFGGSKRVGRRRTLSKSQAPSGVETVTRLTAHRPSPWKGKALERADHPAVGAQGRKRVPRTQSALVMDRAYHHWRPLAIARGRGNIGRLVVCARYRKASSFALNDGLWSRDGRRQPRSLLAHAVSRSKLFVRTKTASQRPDGARPSSVYHGVHPTVTAQTPRPSGWEGKPRPPVLLTSR